MAVNDAFAKSTDGLADTNDLIVDGSGAGTGAVNITEMGGTGSCDIYRETDPTGSGTWDVSVQIDSPGGTYHSQGNKLLVSQSEAVRLRINNTSGGTVDVYAAGYEVDN